MLRAAMNVIPGTMPVKTPGELRETAIQDTK